jgi:tetratricopeptide (TPR) repeat protein
VITQADELIAQIQLNQEKQHQNKVDEALSFSICSSKTGHDQSTVELNGQFLHSQLLIDCLLRMKSISTDKNELISLARKESEGNKRELDILQEFEQSYSPDRSLWWYTRNSFLYRVLNKALRVQQIDLLYHFRFFIRDIEQQLKGNKCSSQIHVYRGQLMSNEEIQSLKDSIGEFISFNSFLSTSVDRKQALHFLSASDVSGDLQRVLFEIDADPRIDGVKPFANITSFSYFPREVEVLMMLGSIFRVAHIYLDNQVWIIQMRLCSDNDHDLKPIFDHMKNELAGGGETNLLSFGIVLRNLGKFDAAEKYYYRLLDELPHDHPDRANCYHALGIVAREKGNYDLSLQWHRKSLELKMGTMESDDPSLAHSHNSIGSVYDAKGDYKQALESYEKALMIWKQAFSENHPKVAMCFNNIGGIYQAEKKYTEALKYHQKALEIRQKCLPTGHPDLGDSYNNIASVHGCLGQYDLALKHLNRSLEISKKSLPPQHPDIAMTLENMGNVYENKGELKEALSYFEKAAVIYRVALPSAHPYIINIKELIRRVSSKLE